MVSGGTPVLADDMSTPTSRALRGTQDSARQHTFYAPDCPVNYYDTTGGRAYWWHCASECPGGPYSDENCECACQVSTTSLRTTTTKTATTRTMTVTTLYLDRPQLRSQTFSHTTTTSRLLSASSGLPSAMMIVGLTQRPTPAGPSAIPNVPQNSSTPWSAIFIGFCMLLLCLCLCCIAVVRLISHHYLLRGASTSPIYALRTACSWDSTNMGWRGIVENRCVIQNTGEQVPPPAYEIYPKHACPPSSVQSKLGSDSALQLPANSFYTGQYSPRPSEASTCPPSHRSDASSQLSIPQFANGHKSHNAPTASPGHERLSRSRGSSPHPSACSSTSNRSRSPSPLGEVAGSRSWSKSPCPQSAVSVTLPGMPDV